MEINIKQKVRMKIRHTSIGIFKDENAKKMEWKVLLNGKNFHNQPFDSEIKQYEQIINLK